MVTWPELAKQNGQVSYAEGTKEKLLKIISVTFSPCSMTEAILLNTHEGQRSLTETDDQQNVGRNKY